MHSRPYFPDMAFLRQLSLIMGPSIPQRNFLGFQVVTTLTKLLQVCSFHKAMIALRGPSKQQKTSYRPLSSIALLQDNPPTLGG